MLEIRQKVAPSAPEHAKKSTPEETPRKRTTKEASQSGNSKSQHMSAWPHAGPSAMREGAPSLIAEGPAWGHALICWDFEFPDCEASFVVLFRGVSSGVLFLACSGAEGATFWRISSMAGVLETSSIGERRPPGPCWCTFSHCRGSCVEPCTHTLGFQILGLDWQWDPVPGLHEYVPALAHWDLSCAN